MGRNNTENRTIYAVVSSDKYELPLYVGTIKEICELFRIKKSTILSDISRSKKKGYKSRYVKIGKMEEEE